MADTWAKKMSRKAKKTNNHKRSRKDKIEIRHRVIEAIPAPRVLDAFAGSGRMYRDVWSGADHYVGCDLKWYPDERLAYVADNTRVLRSIDLGDFNVFDLDAYGSPWTQALIVAERREVATTERIGLCLTDGSSLNLKLGGMPNDLRAVTGLSAPPAGASRLQDEILDLAIAGILERMNCALVRRWQAIGKTGAGVRYIGLILEGI